MTGAQIPRYRIEPERVTTDGADAAALMAAYGNALDEWQQLVLGCWRRAACSPMLKRCG